jgi:hypothetical protein
MERVKNALIVFSPLSLAMERAPSVAMAGEAETRAGTTEIKNPQHRNAADFLFLNEFYFSY